jgi:hypothetical protein
LADIYSQLELWEEYNSEVKKGPALEIIRICFSAALAAAHFRLYYPIQPS